MGLPKNWRHPNSSQYIAMFFHVHREHVDRPWGFWGYSCRETPWASSRLGDNFGPPTWPETYFWHSKPARQKSSLYLYMYKISVYIYTVWGNNQYNSVYIYTYIYINAKWSTYFLLMFASTLHLIAASHAWAQALKNTTSQDWHMNSYVTIWPNYHW